jgi:hypothetical protein
MRDTANDSNEDPELGDENDPEYEEEMFRTYQAMGWKAEAFPDREYAKKYAKWLKTAPPEEKRGDD